MRAKLAVVDDDAEMLALLAMVLGKSGYEVKTYATPGRFLDSLAKSRPDLCVLDMQLPGIHGRDVIRVLRENEATKRMPIVAITAAERETSDVIKGLELGADEYMGKPLDLELFVVRIAGLLRRAPTAPEAPSPSESLRFGDMIVHLDEHRVELKGKSVILTHLEFKLLAYFLRHPRRVVTRGMLLEKVWGTEPKMSTRTVDKHVEALRKKLPGFGAHVETVIRIGYLFRP
ncbi:MAG: response regulator transcription factor [Elusimicrobiota bacterium]|nr:response regulator transcription factor [Elusimicrobiota bacterium]